ncbi:hypothetical protein FRC11_001824, partial [Ceratobasidium sp. 423]
MSADSSTQATPVGPVSNVDTTATAAKSSSNASTIVPTAGGTSPTPSSPTSPQLPALTLEDLLNTNAPDCRPTRQTTRSADSRPYLDPDLRARLYVARMLQIIEARKTDPYAYWKPSDLPAFG